MPLSNNGLTKLQEESAEAIAELITYLSQLIQISAKKSTYLDTDEHPDGKGCLKARLETEMSQVRAAITIVSEILGLDLDSMAEMEKSRYQRFKGWHEDETR